MTTGALITKEVSDRIYLEDSSKRILNAYFEFVERRRLLLFFWPPHYTACSSYFSVKIRRLLMSASTITNHGFRFQ